MNSFTHLNAEGNPAMVDVGAKTVTRRTARAQTIVTLGPDIMQHLNGADIATKKGPVFQTAIIAGTMAAKRTDDLIPLCHSLGLDNCQITITTDGDDAIVSCLVSTEGKTGVEMEALVGASVAALTIYDMCKAFSHDIIIKETKLMEKTGGKRDFRRAYGLILTGGRSSRMGQDKSLLDYHGKPQREHLTDLLKPYCETVFWSVNADQAGEIHDGKQPLIIDRYDLASPLNGILSAFETNPSAAWLVVACDMPLLTSLSIDALLMNRAPDKMATVFYDSDGLSPEPLLGIYESAFGRFSIGRLLNGAVSPRQLLMQNDVQIITIPDRRELTNVNDPEAKAALKQRR